MRGASRLQDVLTAGREPLPQTGDRRPRPAAVNRLLAGPWEHIRPPDTLPAWVSCKGFSGMVVQLDEANGTPGQGEATVHGALRGVGLPDVAEPRYAVIVDIPKNDALGEGLREQTSVKIGDISYVAVEQTADGGAIASRTVTTGEGGAAATTSGTGKRRFNWISSFEYTELDDRAHELGRDEHRGEHRGHLRPPLGGAADHPAAQRRHASS